MTHTSNEARKPFARIAVHPILGQVLAMVDTDSNDEPAIKFIADTHPDDLAPTAVCLSFKAEEDLHAKLEAMTEAEILAMGEAIHNQLVQVMLLDNYLVAV